MRITRVETSKRDVELTRPYTIATRTITAVELFFVRIRTDSGLE
ncbi:MAG: dipeptide epimerase, partial [bacterium]|nr:dipeptide epimerase [bacterium]